MWNKIRFAYTFANVRRIWNFFFTEFYEMNNFDPRHWLRSVSHEGNMEDYGERDKRRGIDPVIYKAKLAKLDHVKSLGSRLSSTWYFNIVGIWRKNLFIYLLFDFSDFKKSYLDFVRIYQKMSTNFFKLMFSNWVFDNNFYQQILRLIKKSLRNPKNSLKSNFGETEFEVLSRLNCKI